MDFCFTVIIVTLCLTSHWQTQSSTHCSLWQILSSILKAAPHILHLVLICQNPLVIKTETVLLSKFTETELLPLCVSYDALVYMRYIWVLRMHWNFDFTASISISTLQISCSKPCQRHSQFMNGSRTVIPRQRVMCHGGLTDVAKAVNISGRSILLWLSCRHVRLQWIVFGISHVFDSVRWFHKPSFIVNWLVYLFYIYMMAVWTLPE